MSSSTTFANENTSIFIVQIDDDNNPNTTFILDLENTDHLNRIKITDEGEIYVKINKIIPLSKTPTQPLLLNDSIQSLLRVSDPEIRLTSIHSGWRCSNCLRINSPGSYVCTFCYKPKSS